jgi:predicted metalloprotease with PDZ domain
MRTHIVRALIVVTAAVGTLLVSADEQKCHSSANECERQIRQMLSGRRYLGIDIVDLKPGLMITKVRPNSPAARSELKEGDRLIAVNGRSAVKVTPSEFKAMLADARPTGTLWLIVQRRGAFRRVETRLEPYPEEYVNKVVAAHLSSSHTATAGAQP